MGDSIFNFFRRGGKGSRRVSLMNRQTSVQPCIATPVNLQRECSTNMLASYISMGGSQSRFVKNPGEGATASEKSSLCPKGNTT